MSKNRNAATPVADEELEMIETEVEAEEAEGTEEITFSAKELAAELHLDAKSFRRWLRNWTNDRANKGGRWVFTADRKAEILAAYKADHSPKQVEEAAEA
jgi:hypothetical protein